MNITHSRKLLSVEKHCQIPNDLSIANNYKLCVITQERYVPSPYQPKTIEIKVNITHADLAQEQVNNHSSHGR